MKPYAEELDMKTTPEEIKSVKNTLEEVSEVVRKLLDKHEERQLIAALAACVGVMVIDKCDGDVQEANQFFSDTYSKQSLLELKKSVFDGDNNG